LESEEAELLRRGIEVVENVVGRTYGFEDGEVVDGGGVEGTCFWRTTKWSVISVPGSYVWGWSVKVFGNGGGNADGETCGLEELLFRP
jgi:hypothetical protein